MDESELIRQLHQLNESELFYRDYRQARASQASFPAWLGKLDPETVRRRALIIPEWPETVTPEYLEESFFSPDRRVGIHVSKHNCFTPPVPHSHDFFEMFYVYDGQCVHQVGKQRSMLSAGDLCLIQPHVVHALDVSDESVIVDVLIRRSTFRHYFYSILQGDNLLANFFMSTLYSTRGIDYLIFHTAEDPVLRHALTELCMESFGQQAYYSVLINALVTRIFVQLLRLHTGRCELPDGKLQDTQTAIRIARYLQMNAASATLDGLAADFHYSPEYTSRLVKRVTGQPFIRLLTSVRMENAEQLLRDTTLPITDIAAVVGYESGEHFIRTFHRHKGLTPSAYRRRHASAPAPSDITSFQEVPS